jgi:hypothetical protein
MLKTRNRSSGYRTGLFPMQVGRVGHWLRIRHATPIASESGDESSHSKERICFLARSG